MTLININLLNTLMNIIQKWVFRTFQCIIIEAVRVEFGKIEFRCSENVNKIIFELFCLFCNEVIRANVATIFFTDYDEAKEWMSGCE